jgi:hypothetical protein
MYNTGNTDNIQPHRANTAKANILNFANELNF